MPEASTRRKLRLPSLIRVPELRPVVALTRKRFHITSIHDADAGVLAQRRAPVGSDRTLRARGR
jgi:hypothetical protein